MTKKAQKQQHPTIVLTEKQTEALALAQSDARFILYRGGSRSGKTFSTVYFVIKRAMATPNSRHAIFRLIGNDARITIWDLTLRQVFELLYPGLWESLVKSRKINDTEMTIELPNGSILRVSGLDDSTRQERILGDEYNTIYVNEVSQFKTFDIFQKLISRLSQEKPIIIDGRDTGRVLKPKLFLDCNPPRSKRHWTYDAFMRKINPQSQTPWPRPDEWQQMVMNPVDNQANISSTYLEDLQNLSAADRRRFLEGEWGSENENGLFRAEYWAGDGRFARWPVMSPAEARETMDYIAVTIDPASSASQGSDNTGMIVLGKRDGEAFVLADRSGKLGPRAWAERALQLVEEWGADAIVVERDGGADYVKDNIRAIDPAAPIIEVKTGGKSKPTRAIPVANLYEQGLVHHCGEFADLEAQMEEFHLDWSRKKDGSPDRLDALVHGVTQLLTKPKPSNGGRQGRARIFC